MKNFVYFAAVLAIAFLVATQFGLNILFLGIAICFVGECIVFDAGGVLESAKTYETRLKYSRTMLVCHVGWYVCTLLLAAIFDVLGGYTYYIEEAIGNSFKYQPIYQDGGSWYWLFALLVLRGALQIIFDQHIKENIERSKNLPA